jgi:lysophospholipase L1-like esterase
MSNQQNLHYSWYRGSTLTRTPIGAAMKRHWILGSLAVALLAVQAAWAQPAATDVKSIQPEPQTADWAKDWWGKRHEEKLAEKKKLGQVDVIMIGDSITHGWENGGKATWDKYYDSRKALNLGYSGDRTENVLWRLQHGEVDDIAPKLAIIMIGTNNAGHRKEKSADTATGIKAILDELGKRLPNTKCLLLAIFPRDEKPDGEYRQINDATNKIIASYADNQRVFFLDINKKFLSGDGTLPADIMPDRLHPNEKGYAIWAEAIEPTVEKLLKSEK